MFDADKIVGFQWGLGNARKNADKHGVTQAEAEQPFFNQPLVIAPDRQHSQDESQYHALGITDNSRRLHVTFTLRDGETLIRVISARDMLRKERAIYEHATQETS